MILDTRSKLQIIIDCSVLLRQESILKQRLKIQDLSSLEFHARRLTHVLHTNRYRLLNHPDQTEKTGPGDSCIYIYRATVNIGAPSYLECEQFITLLPSNNVFNNELSTQEERRYSHNICAVLHLCRFR